MSIYGKCKEARLSITLTINLFLPDCATRTPLESRLPNHTSQRRLSKKAFYLRSFHFHFYVSSFLTVNFHFSSLKSRLPNHTSQRCLSKKAFYLQSSFHFSLSFVHFFQACVSNVLAVNFHFSPLESGMHDHTSQGRSLPKAFYLRLSFHFHFDISSFLTANFHFFTFMFHIVSLIPFTFHDSTHACPTTHHSILSPKSFSTADHFFTFIVLFPPTASNLY